MRTAEISSRQAGSNEWHPIPAAFDFESLRDLAETYTTYQLLQGLEELSGQRAEHLLTSYTKGIVPPEERKQAMYDFCVVSMAEEPLVPSKNRHNPWEFPEWLLLAHARMSEFIMTDLDARQTLADTQLFGGDSDFLHNFANSVSASIMPKDAHVESDQVFAVGVLTEQIRPWVLPDIRADELTLA